MKNDFGSISRLSEKCRKCPYVKTCNQGLKEQMKKDFYRKVGIGVIKNAS